MEVGGTNVTIRRPRLAVSEITGTNGEGEKAERRYLERDG
jgi:hypothetical protein